MDDTLRINIVGAGHWGPNVIRAFAAIGGVTVGTVADTDGKRLAILNQHFPALHTTTDPNRVIDDPAASAVAIVTPVVTHYELARGALLAGKDVFVEKPLARTSDECAELAKIAARSGRVLMVGHIFLFNSGVLKIKQLIDSGEIGQVIYIDAVRTNLGPIRNDINALWDLASHDFSIFDYWLGAPAQAVSAAGRRFSESRVEDVVFATVTYNGGAAAHVHASWLNPRKVRQITVVGDKRMVVWDDINLSQPVQIYSHGISISRTDYADTFGAHRLNYHTGDLLIPRVSGDEPLRSECLHFIRCVRDRTLPRADAALGRRVVEILVAADHSLQQQGQFVTIRQ